MYERINDVFPDWINGGGIFSALNNFDVPWKNQNIFNSLDITYHGNFSGSKIVSPLVGRMLDDMGKLSPEKINDLAKAIYTIYGTNWSKLFKTLTQEYNPIENYDMTETETVKGKTDLTRTTSGNSNTTNTGSIKNDRDIVETGDTSNNNNVFGFNSVNAVGSDTQTGNANKNTVDGMVETRDIKDTVIMSTNDVDSGTNSTDRTLTRHGNIGVTTSQQMLQSERELWKWLFYHVVFKNIDDMLTLSIY